MGARPRELKGLLELAEQAARLAGEFLVQARGSAAIVTTELERDVKLAADWESEERILCVLRKKSAFAILSEERQWVGERDSRPKLRWIVDPLDGSLNYLKGIPLSCVCVGLWRDEEPVLGAVFDFNQNEMFTGIVGVGAWLNGKSIHVSSVSERDRAVLCTGFPVSSDFSPGALTKYIEHVRQFKKVRLLGSAALSLAYIAMGRVDAYFERDIKVWDIAAGVALVCAAGGRVIKVTSRQVDAVTIYASNGALPPLDCVA